MAKLHFIYATMNSGKSIDLLRTAYNYEENGYRVLVIKPETDTKANKNIQTRIGLERKTDLILKQKDSIFDKIKLKNITCIFIDEAQFLTKKQVDELFILSKAVDIPVFCYGLRIDFTMKSFEGSQRLLEIADELEELKTLCSCGNVAREVGRKVNGKYVKTGKKVIIDGSDKEIEYIPLCGKCYLKEVKKEDLNKYKEKVS